MEGMWKFNFVKNHNERPADFFKPQYDDSKWVDFPVPGLFEIHGYGDKIYRNVGYSWATTFKSNPPYISEQDNYTGSYRREFTLPESWRGQDVFFHVGSATSNLTLWVNGKYVGYSEDSKIAAEFNITKYLKKGKNLIAMQVMRWCDGSYLEDQDFWRFTGIAREVYLYAREKTRIADIIINADLENGYKDGALTFDIPLSGDKKANVDVTLKDADGKVKVIHCVYDPLSKGGETPDGRKVKGTIHWVSAAHAVDAEVRLIDNLFTLEDPSAVPEGEDWHDYLNPESMVIKQAKVEPSLANAKREDRFQFMRQGYFCLDSVDSKPGHLVFNRTVGLKDSFNPTK